MGKDIEIEIKIAYDRKYIIDEFFSLLGFGFFPIPFLENCFM